MIRRSPTRSFQGWVSALDIFCALILCVLVLYVHAGEELVPDASNRLRRVELKLDLLRARLGEARKKLEGLKPPKPSPAPAPRPGILAPQDPNRPALQQALRPGPAATPECSLGCPQET